ncbi:C-X-C motif chemokine 9 isoform X2 [Austrofundulus limnaeus]|uniref:C-X-C motif chemokine 9 isoform X2 n=1 Tax=Austrofundulus limnaeus TaxID=52670 RepID=A0A2I4B821_AUSLI|nr:PREDICTED: C-X-C motif chemokine 9-like isoform X2 [Austrofundulus limnaeus]
MSGIIKVFLLLAVVACVAEVQPGQSCLCQRFRNGIDSKSSPKDIQFYPATIFCDRVELVVTSENGYRYCLNTDLQAVKKMIARFMKARKTSTSNPTDVTSSSGFSATTGTSIDSETSSTSGTSGSWCLAE